jgi:hypothetical protein
MVAVCRNVGTVMCRFLNSRFGLLLLGSAITVFVGNSLAARYDASLRERDCRRQWMERELAEQQELLESLTSDMASRFYLLQNMIWLLESGSHKEARLFWEERYTPVKDQWNIRLAVYRHKLTWLMEPEIASLLLMEDSARDYPNKHKCVHSHFILAHAAIRDWLRAAEEPGYSWDEGRSHEALANKELKALGAKIEEFRGACFRHYYQEYNGARAGKN